MVKYSLVGYDSSDTSQRAFRFAMGLARCSGGRVRVVYVLQVVQGGADACSLMMTDESRNRSDELLEELRTIDPDTSQRVDLEITHGSPGDVLVNQVRQHPEIDHIVIGHTSRGTLGRWLLGSVSEDVLAGAHVPVTVVR
ncbi:universal stress protein [Dyella caseinilytica]|uniref:Universal stress protein n=1 Tax=Dyella caseinilytica TaxID=1849581 RepID=A0ABX7GTF2_9GAMM|nr:universal stress protein [Dyella caseinilytica]QRN53154.1 universal stress protein [Dyella caseinilytica]GGA11866.1 universal stress protein UspA [Dyella caseinilytica]